MKWISPVIEEIKMDAEIGSYQPDDERFDEPTVSADDLDAGRD